MSARADRNTQVDPESLTNRDGDAAVPARRKDGKETEPDFRAQLESLKARITEARQLAPQPHELHCRDCFNRGRNAAIRLIAGE